MQLLSCKSEEEAHSKEEEMKTCSIFLLSFWSFWQISQNYMYLWLLCFLLGLVGWCVVLWHKFASHMVVGLVIAGLHFMAFYLELLTVPCYFEANIELWCAILKFVFSNVLLTVQFPTIFVGMDVYFGFSTFIRHDSQFKLQCLVWSLGFSFMYLGIYIQVFSMQ